MGGAVCAPKCTLGIFCPHDVPTGVTATPTCALQDSSTGKKYCALMCQTGYSTDDSQCGTNASCKSIQGTGICTYDDDAANSEATQVMFSPSMVSASHYEDPKAGCSSDEVDIQIQGVQGAVCSPACTGTTCPTDVPTGVTATPTCALQDASSGKKYCALICSPSSNDAQCGTNASCKSIQGTGLCTYDDDADNAATTEVMFSGSHYEDPKDGCSSDEVSIQIQGVQGAVCSP